jgi:hypothetical protein
MISDDPYSDWKSRRRQVGVDRHFTDRVMDRIGQREPPQRGGAAVVAERRASRFAWRMQLAAAVVVVGLGVGLVRTGSVILFLLLSASKGY